MQCLLILIVLDKEINIQFQAAETFAKAVLSDILMMNDAEVHIVLGNRLVFFIIMVSKHETLQPPFGSYLQLL